MRGYATLEQSAQASHAWLEASREFLGRWDSARLPVIERIHDEAQSLLEPARRELPICFLGNSGVGKSTLINALVDPHVFVVSRHGGAIAPTQLHGPERADRGPRWRPDRG